MNVLKTIEIKIINYCQEQFAFKLPSMLVVSRTKKFNSKIICLTMFKVSLMFRRSCNKFIYLVNL